MKANAEVKMERKPYGGWPNGIYLSNGQIELVATADVGPRILRLGFVGGKNFMKEFADQLGQTGGETFRAYGGHRFWHAPEVFPRTYAPDNSPVQVRFENNVLTLTPPVEAGVGMQKELEITLDPQSNKITVLHRLINHNVWSVEAAPWGLTVMQGPGRAILPQEPASKALLPTRPMVMWGYTDMRDPRWNWGSRYIQLRCDPGAKTPQKLGIMNTQGWAAYATGQGTLVKRFGYDPKAVYPDYGCNNETYTDGDMLEVESLAPLTRLEPQGRVEHVEEWFLFPAVLGESEEELDKQLLPMVGQTRA